MSEDKEKPIDRRARKSMAAIVSALRTLLANGEDYQDITIKQIADLADVNPTTLYAHFHDKEGVLLALIEEKAGEIVKIITEFEHADPRVKLMNIIANISAFYYFDPALRALAGGNSGKGLEALSVSIFPSYSDIYKECHKAGYVPRRGSLRNYITLHGGLLAQSRYYSRAIDMMKEIKMPEDALKDIGIGMVGALMTLGIDYKPAQEVAKSSTRTVVYTALKRQGVRFEMDN